MTISAELLDALLSSGPSRQEAESHFSSLPLMDRIQGLVAVISTTKQSDYILISSVLLRRDIATLGGQALQQQIPLNSAIELLKNLVGPLLQLFQTLPSAPCRRQVGYCLTEIICSLSLVSLQDSEYALQSILTTINPLCRTADSVSLRLLANMAERIPNTVCKSGIDFIGIFQDALQSSMNPEALSALTEAVCNVAIATQAAASGTPDTVSFLSSTRLDHLSVDSNSPAAKIGKSCLISLLSWIEQVTREDSVHSCLEHLAHAASTCPSLLAGDMNVFSSLVRTCLQIAGRSTDLALSACQVLGSLCAVGYVKRRILPSHVAIRDVIKNDILRVCAELVVSGVDDDVEEWAMEPATIMDEVPTWEEDDTAIYAESLLFMFLQSLGGTQALPVLLPMVETLLASSEWKQQRAALSILEQCLFAAPVTFAQYLPVAVETALQLASTNDNLRVQFQAVVLLGALCEAEADQDIDGNIRSQYGARILQVFARTVQSRCSKIAAVSTLSMVSYCRGGGGSVDAITLVVPYLKELLMALVTGPLSLEVSESGAVAVKIRAIGAVACLAQSAGEAFVPFYSDVMPGLLACTQLPSQSYEMSRLRGAAMEAATIVGQAVSESNRDLFVGDAEKIMHMAIPLLQTEDSSSSVIPMDELLSACARIASVMGEEYAPFVGVVLPHLLSRVSAPPDMQFSEGDEDGLEATKRGDAEMDEEEGTEHLTFTVSLPGKGITKVTVNTTKILEKAQAARAIYEHAAALGAAFGPYAETTLEALLPLVDFRYSAEVRATVAQAISPVYEAACAYGESSAMQIPRKYLPLLADSLSKQVVMEDPSDPEVMFALADSLSDVFYFAYRTLDGPTGRQILGSYTTDQAKSTVQCVMEAMVLCLKRRAELLRTLEDLDGALSGEDERDEYVRALESEQEVLTPLVDVVGYTIKFLRAEALPLFDSEVAPTLAPYLKAGAADARARFASVCLFDDCVEHCGSTAAAKYAPYLLEGALLGMDDATNGQDVQLKQVSVYGIAQLARYAPAAILVPQAERLVNSLVNICSVPKDATEHVALVENGVSALASLVLIGNAPFGKGMDAAKKSSIASNFLGQLPLREDESEAKIVHSGLCDLVENGQVCMTTEAERLLRIIGEIFLCVSEGEDLASPDIQSRLAKILLQMQQNVPSDVMHQAFGSLADEYQQCINSVMNEFRAQSGNLVSP